jgi:hypothetical protein
MNTEIPTTAAPPDDGRTLYITNPLRVALCLALGGSLSGHVSNGGKMLTFQVENAPPNFIQDHEAGRLCAPTDLIEQKHAFISGVIRENTRGLEARAQANRVALGAISPSPRSVSSNRYKP